MIYVKAGGWVGGAPLSSPLIARPEGRVSMKEGEEAPHSNN